jgi:hypothetical protein
MASALFKRGNHDGEQYDAETCVQRVELIFSPPVVPTKAYGANHGAHYEGQR